MGNWATSGIFMEAIELCLFLNKLQLFIRIHYRFLKLIYCSEMYKGLHDFFINPFRANVENKVSS